MSAPIRVVVVDDEPLGRTGLRTLLDADSEIAVVGEAASVESAVTAIESLRPELVTLDVQMPDGTGFDVIRKIGPDAMPAVVFVTAYNEFAVHAFEVNAVDYLLKPFDDERFAITMHRAKKVVRQSHVSDLSRKLAELLGSTPAPSGPAPQFIDRLVVKTGGRSFFLRADEIDWIEAADYCVKVHSGKAVHVLRESMNSLEKRLDPGRFFRVHRSAIVNLDGVRELRPYFKGDQILVMKNGTKLKLSRGRRMQLEAIINRK